MHEGGWRRLGRMRGDSEGEAALASLLAGRSQRGYLLGPTLFAVF
jgi:hypothetical protein